MPFCRAIASDLHVAFFGAAGDYGPLALVDGLLEYRGDANPICHHTRQQILWKSALNTEVHIEECCLFGASSSEVWFIFGLFDE